MRKIIVILVFLLSPVSCKTEKDILLDTAKHGNLASRAAAVKNLSSCTEERCQKVLLEALYDRSPLVRREAALALGKQKVKSIWPLIHSLNDPDLRVKLNILHSLEKLKDNPEIIYAVILKTEDSSLLIRKAARDFLYKAGFTISDIIESKTFIKRLEAYKAAASSSADDRAYAIKLFADYGKSADFAFIVSQIHSSDPFILRNSLYGLGDGRPEHLEILQKLPNTAARLYALENWIEKAPSINRKSLKILLELLPLSKIAAYKDKIKTDFPCSLLKYKNISGYLYLYKNSKCSPDNLNLHLKIKLYEIETGKIPEKVAIEAEKQLKTLDGQALSALLKHGLYEKQIFGMLRNGWFKYLYFNTKWIDEKMWNKLDYTGLTGLTPNKTAARLTPRERFLKKFKRGIPDDDNNDEFIPPPFDEKSFADKITALRYLKSFTPLETGFINSLLNFGPSRIKTAALKILTKKHNGLQKTPEPVFDILKEGTFEQKKYCIQVLAVFDNFDELRNLYKKSDADLKSAILSVFAEKGGEKTVKLLLKEFKKAPNAETAEVLAKLKVKEAVPVYKDILRDETPDALAAERAKIIKACMLTNESCTDELKNEIWDKNIQVRKTALSFIKDKNILKAFAYHDPSPQIRQTALKKLKIIN